MLHSWSSYDLTPSLYNHVQNDCQIYQPVGVFCFGLGFFFIEKNFFLSSLENAANLESPLWRFILLCLYGGLDGFSFC